MKRKIALCWILSLVAFQFAKASEEVLSLIVPTDPEQSYTLASPKASYNPEFSWEHIAEWYPVSDTISEARNEAITSFKEIDTGSLWIDNFSNEDIQALPLGIKHQLDNLEYAIGIIKAKVSKDYTTLTVFARIRLPQTDSNGHPIELFFGADDVKLSHQGGIIGDAKLVLLGDVHIPFNAGKWMLTLEGGFNYKTGATKDKTYVTIGCSGVKELGIKGAVEFSRTLILPIETRGSNAGIVNLAKTTITKTITTDQGTRTIKVPHRVKGDFQMVVSSWNDILVDVSLQPFVLAEKRNNKNYDGNFQFFINKAVLDFSDLRNDSRVKFPKYYKEHDLLLPNKSAWRGVYVHTVEVKMPKEFMTSKTLSRGNTERVAFGAHHLIIDNFGVSGTFYADNIFPLDEGRTNDTKAWAYSLDHIELTIAANTFIGAGLEGQIVLPVSKKERISGSESEKIGLRYSGLISPEEYLLNVTTESVIDFNLWKAKGQLLPNSSIELAVREGQFRPKAILHGNLEIKANKASSENQSNSSDQKSLIDFKGIEFQNLVLQTESPVFKVDYMGYTGKVKLAGFPVSISNIGITANEAQANLYFDLEVNMMDSEEANAFSGRTNLAIIGKFEEERYLQKWKFSRLELNEIAIDTDLGGFAISGSVKLMKDDKVYGDGFAGSLEASFGLILTTKIKVNAIFGKKEFRYWMVDALVDFPPGTGAGVNLSGFAGGASYRMKRQDFGASINGDAFTYAPDKSTGLGVKAMVLLNFVEDSVLKGGAGFEIIFNRHGGINLLSFYGQGAILGVKIPGMDKISKLYDKISKNTGIAQKFLKNPKPEDQQSFASKHLFDKANTEFPAIPSAQMDISAKLGITMDFQNSVFHGELDVYINVPGGFVEGRGSEGRAGWAVLHIGPKEWYFYLGTPQDRLGLKIGVGPLNVVAGGYFMVGSVLPDSPPPPPIVASILGVAADELDYMRDENALESGRGFAFGADIAIDTGDLRFLLFYARFQAGAGFDIMLRDYGAARCSNTNKQVGINGWYANGQAYAYLQGELGIRIKLFFVKKKIPIIKGGAAVLLQAKAPNPVWMRGYVGGYFSLLGGLIKGKFRFKITLGKECVFDENAPLGGLKIITDVRPKDGAGDLDVFAIPQATFSMKIGEPITIPEDDGDKTYRIDLEQFVILHKGKEIPGTLEWSAFKDRANFVSSDILPPDQKLTVRVEVSFKEKVQGVFKPILIDGKPAKELEERNFTTGDAPDHIPLHNISYAYPVIDQKYFFEDESDQAYIQLRRGQDYLFEDDAWRSFVTYYKNEDQALEPKEFKYHTGNNQLSYTVPNIEQETMYSLKIVSISKASTDLNATRTTLPKKNSSHEGSAYKKGVEKTEVQIQQNKAQLLSKEGQIERLTYAFKTSRYKTFKKKINSISTINYNAKRIYSDVILLTNRIKDHEAFDIPELLGTRYTDHQPLIQVEATLDDSYYIDDINPPLYSKYPLGGKFRVSHREEHTLGMPPRYAIPIRSKYLANLEYEVNNEMLRTTFPFYYNLGFEYKSDWTDLIYQIVNDDLDRLHSSNSSALEFLDEDYLFMRYGYYNVKLRYILPGGAKGTQTSYKFKNQNKFR